jgi:hypothetical protein
VKNWCGVEWCSGHPTAEERHLVDMSTGRYRCCGTDALRSDAFHAAGCPNGPSYCVYTHFSECVCGCVLTEPDDGTDGPSSLPGPRHNSDPYEGQYGTNRRYPKETA